MLVVVLATVLVAAHAHVAPSCAPPLGVLQDDALALLDEARASVDDAADEIDRVERLVTSAERLDEAKRAIATPVVKAMAFGTGVSRAAQRLRDGESLRPRPEPAVETPEIGIVIKRLVWLIIGFLLGLGSSWTLMRRVRRVAVRLAPPDVVDRWSGNVRAAVNEGRDAMRGPGSGPQRQLRP